MPKLTSCCITATAFLALTLSAHAWPDTAAARATGLYSGSGVAPVILIADEKKDGSEKNAVDEKKPAEEQKAGDEKKSAESADRKKKSRREHTVSKREIMRRVRQHLPSEYQEYVR
jgi:hypothetical protein